MRNIKSLLLIFVSLNIALAASDIVIKTWTLDSGMQVAFVEQSNKIVNINMAFDAGASRDQNNYGIASMTNSLLELGSLGMSAKDIAQSFESIGAVFSGNTYKDFSLVSLQSLREDKYFTRAKNTFIKVISQPAFLDSEISRLTGRTITKIKFQNENPQTIALQKFFNTIYKNHPYGHPNNGTEETINAITKKQISEFYTAHYTAANAKLVIVGDLSLEKARELASNIADALPRGKKLANIAPAKFNKPSVTYINYPSKQSSLVFGYVAISPKDKDYYALMLAQYILGGNIDSRLPSVIREQKGLVYNVSSHFIPLKAYGPFLVTLQTKASSIDDATAATTPVIEEFLKKGVTQRELDTAKNVISTSYANTFTTNGSIASAVMRQLVYALAPNYINDYTLKIQAVSLEDINKAIKKHISLGNSAYVTVGPTKGNTDEFTN